MSRTNQQVLKDINAQLPADVDWRQGALDFVAAWSANIGVEQARNIQLTTPLRPADHTVRWTLAETTQYLYNFTNTLSILDLKPGASVLDVACGGGWFSHYLMRCGFKTFGIDISSDFIAFAKQRIADDPHIVIDPETIFAVHDIEIEPMASAGFDAAVLESCLHHFIDPISALSHISDALRPDGVVVIIEGENRSGPIKPQWIDEMRVYGALERPYPRNLLEEVLINAGFPAFEFVGQINGWFSPNSPQAVNIDHLFRESYSGKNHVIAARSEEALRRVVPHRLPVGEKLRFGRGFYPYADGWRWAGPQADIDVLWDGHFTLRLLGYNSVLASPQQISAFSHKRGACGHATLIAGSASATIEVDLQAGDTLTLCSDFAFSPAWTGAPDGRLLSFALAAE